MSQFLLTFSFTYFWKQLQSTFYFMLQFLQWTILRILWVKGVFSLYLSIPGLWKGTGKFFTGVLESPGQDLDFFQWKSGNPASFSSTKCDTLRSVFYHMISQCQYIIWWEIISRGMTNKCAGLHWEFGH